jgi:molecular chaperone DnaJ
MAAAKDYYQLLGVPDTASVDEIKKAFRRLAKQYHPDRNPNNPPAAERFKEITEAYDVVSDAAKRKKYDQLRKYGAFAGAGARSGGRGGQGGGGGQPDLALTDRGSFGGLGDLFSSIFGQRGAGREPGADEEIETAVTIPFRVAALGGKVPVTLPLTEVCPKCGGSGAAPRATISTCAECRGRGTVSFGQGGFAVNRPCPVCRGKGKVPSERCGTCHGSGEVRVEKRLMITVSPGTDEGARVRLKGEGTKARGDIVVVFHVEPDRFFRREGLDVLCVVPINVAQAMLGSKLKVKTLDGRRVVLKVPPGTQHGQKFRIAGQGIDKSGRRGDQYVEVRVEIPEQLTPEQEAAARAFAEKAGMKH